MSPVLVDVLAGALVLVILIALAVTVVNWK